MPWQSLKLTFSPLPPAFWSLTNTFEACSFTVKETNFIIKVWAFV